ncbi:NVEALA domain-containing protein [Phocaeicola coprocola]|jgi:hypothetical protein
MNKKILKVVFVSAFALVAGYSVYASQQKVEMSDLAMANIEALASGENDHSQKIWERYYRPDGTGYNCTKTGNETC